MEGRKERKDSRGGGGEGRGRREGREGGRRGRVQYKGGLLPYLVIKTSICGW